ncbi:hypothetical protein [Zhongshania sp.]|uniref:hypothetical protein n=1 Tax=Zhongshania sp. TaxID=1971902 RepID=UPI001B52EAB1|nr:hypothetical protein [Zhongshania sp.]MBQ0759267.1 hypothetical protein [Zhongshania sp.]MBQ0795685.1 hypothetical protein [Zhongshania sp.]
MTPLLADILFDLSSRQSSLRCIARGGWILNQVEDDGGGALRMTAWKVGGDGLEGWGDGLVAGMVGQYDWDCSLIRWDC